MSEPRDIVGEAIERMEVAARTLPGTFHAKFAVCCHGGAVLGAENWQCEVEGDIWDTTFDVWGHSPVQAIERGIREAWRRVPPHVDGLIEVVPFAPVADADEAFERWLWVLTLDRESVPRDALRIEMGRDATGGVRRYLVRPDGIPV